MSNDVIGLSIDYQQTLSMWPTNLRTKNKKITLQPHNRISNEPRVKSVSLNESQGRRNDRLNQRLVLCRGDSSEGRRRIERDERMRGQREARNAG